MHFQKKSFLITGGCGFIGSCFVKKQLQLGHHVVVLDALTYAGHRENLDTLSKKEASHLELIVDTICNPSTIDTLLKKHGVDVLVHFAAESHVDQSIHTPGKFIETNIQGTFTLLHTTHQYWKNLPHSKKENFRYIQISTDEVYGSLAPEEERFTENTPFAPNSPYAASKASGDLLVRAWFHTYGFPTLTTHCSNNYGPYQFPEKLIPHLILCALAGKPLPIYGDGKNIRDWIHVEDHCHGIHLAIEKGILGATYCFGGNSEFNNLQVVEKICEYLDSLHPRQDKKKYATQITFVEDRLGHDRRYAINDTHAQKELGFFRKHDFHSGLKATIQWYLDNPNWCQNVLKKEKKG